MNLPDLNRNSESTLQVLWLAFRLLPSRDKRRVLGVATITGIAAFAEMIAVASILPFLAMLGDPGVLDQNALLGRLHDFFGTSEPQKFLQRLGTFAFGLLIIAAAFRMVAFYFLARFAQGQKHALALRRLKFLMNQPYAFFLRHHSGDLSKGVLSEIDQLVHHLFMPASVLVMQTLRFCFIVVLLLLVDPILACAVGAFLVGCYALIQLAVRRRVSVLGQAQKDTNSARYTATSEAFANIKQIKVAGGERVFLDQFSRPSKRAASVATQRIVIAQAPRILVEAVAVGAIIALSLILIGRQTNADGPAELSSVLPLLGLYALAGYRMLPAIQGIYTAATDIRYAGPVLRSLYGHLSQPVASRADNAPIAFAQKLSLKDVEFAHSSASGASLQNVSFEISKGQTVGIVGPSGAGKTTLLDVILGLLPPTRGQVCVDDVPLSAANTRNWQDKIGYVPQDIILSDDSVAANIALYVRHAQIDMDRVIRVAKIAQIHDYLQDLPMGYDTPVGERGARLSGGERQRIGIARALYRDPEILVLDEATSALDTQTETSLLAALDTIGASKTVIIVAHRLSMLQRADTILCLQGGEIVGQGTFSELAKTNQIFQGMLGSTAEKPES